MGVEQAAPCRHKGAPPEAVVAQVVRIIEAIGQDDAYLHSRGLSPEEYRLALPVAIEQMRGRSSASNNERRDFLTLMLDHLVAVPGNRQVHDTGLRPRNRLSPFHSRHRGCRGRPKRMS